MSAPTNKELINLATSLLENGHDTEGICHECGETQSGVEPDAENYTCETCGANKVFGAEQTLILLVGI